GRSRPHPDRQSAARDGGPVVRDRPFGEEATLHRGLWQHASGDRPRLRSRGRGRGFGRLADPLGRGRRRLARALPRMSSAATPVPVLGTGVAGCAAALSAARGGASVTIVTRAQEARESNTFYAQGGIVARPSGDTPERLAADIARAGDGLCSP